MSPSPRRFRLPNRCAAAPDRSYAARFLTLRSGAMLLFRRSLATPPTPRRPARQARRYIRFALRPGGRGLTVGDIAETRQVPGVAPSPCNACSALQLLSDPNNVDFKPYLLQVLALVKRNWLTVIPDSARRAARNGGAQVRHRPARRRSSLEFTTPSGTDLTVPRLPASAPPFPSRPFPPIPGDQIRLQMAFAYNMVSPR